MLTWGWCFVLFCFRERALGSFFESSILLFCSGISTRGCIYLLDASMNVFDPCIECLQQLMFIFSITSSVKFIHRSPRATNLGTFQEKTSATPNFPRHFLVIQN
ncbi:hypothetical protein H0G86_011543 [Trichoderma simmonsii]|uniref:Secreted protein n=1 Tax=Trichoderma simmonsii TaxID=1491479 RepID=A0A8G0LPM6_9HYPO|nr:hypothetical protein H0G86_011543 [Trichoderma simmonsii]